MIRRVRLLFIAPFVLVMAMLAQNAFAQTQYSIGYPSPEQQYMLELINHARANGGAEAARLGLSSLQEGPPMINGQVWTIENSVQPLSWNPLLMNCAQARAKFLNDNDQLFRNGSDPHTYGNSDPNSRIAAGGYSMAPYTGPTNGGVFPGPENVSESANVGQGAYTGANLIAAVLGSHNGLFIDQTVPGRGHRSTTMLGFYREIGIGISSGKDNGNFPGQPDGAWDSLYIVQNFGTQVNSTPFITGVAYEDLNGNGFYDPGEGVGGLRVDVTGTNYFAITSPSGGYSVPVPVPVPGNGSYTVTFSGGPLQTPSQKTINVTNSLNGKVDLLLNGPVSPTLLANVSTRLPVGTDPNALIAGFILTGTQDKKVIVRAIGPSLPFAGALADPILELYGPNGLIASNDDWQNQSAADKQAVMDSTIPPSNNLESALVRTLPANNAGYTAVVRGVGDTTGIAVVEVFDLDQNANSRLANVSTRGFVQTGDNVLFAGTIVLGQTSQRVIVRAIGPSLNVPGKMANPTLQLVDSNGTQVAFNDDWRTDQEVDIIASTVPPSDNAESAIVTTLSGNGSNYTAIVRGAGGSTGIAVVEVFALN